MNFTPVRTIRHNRIAWTYQLFDLAIYAFL